MDTMAKRRTSTALAPIRINERFSMPRPAPIIVRVPRAVSAPKKTKGSRRRHHEKLSLLGVIVGGAALGYIDKTGVNIPTLPVLGRAGTIALGCYFFRSKSPWIRDACVAAAAIASYEQMRMGSISGVASQLGGIAAQT